MIPTILESEVRALFAINGSSITGVIPDLVEKVCYLFGINSITDLKLYIIPNSTGQTLNARYRHGSAAEVRWAGLHHDDVSYREQ